MTTFSPEHHGISPRVYSGLQSAFTHIGYSFFFFLWKCLYGKVESQFLSWDPCILEPPPLPGSQKEILKFRSSEGRRPGWNHKGLVTWGWCPWTSHGQKEWEKWGRDRSQTSWGHSFLVHTHTQLIVRAWAVSKHFWAQFPLFKMRIVISLPSGSHKCSHYSHSSICKCHAHLSQGFHVCQSPLFCRCRPH